MARVTTTNYNAEADTQFAWATTGSDFFSRELDLYRLAQAVEEHDHSAGRGLAVTRIAAAALAGMTFTGDPTFSGTATFATLAVSGSVTGAVDFDGNVNIDGTLNVEGAVTVDDNIVVTGTGAVAGNFAVNTDKFTVAAASGNTLVAGTLAVTGDVAVATNKFTVAAASGNTAIAGTLGVTGNFAINTNKFTVVAASGNTNIAGVIDVTGVGLSTFAGPLDVTGALTAYSVISPAAVVGTPAANGLYRENVVKAWGAVTSAGVLSDGFNVAASRAGTGEYTLTWDRDFANANYSLIITTANTGSIAGIHPRVEAKAAGSATIITQQPDGTFLDCAFNFIAIGDQ